MNWNIKIMYDMLDKIEIGKRSPNVEKHTQ